MSVNNAENVPQITPILDSNTGSTIENNEGDILCQILENGVENISFVSRTIVEEGYANGTIPEIQEISENQEPLESPSTKVEWGDDDTRLLLDIYSSQLENVGPLKKFRKKKDLWNHISLEIEKQLKLRRSSSQCQTRYKTVLKRKSDQDTQNKTSGQIRMSVSFENEINKIKAIDDSLEPQVCLSADNIVINNKTKDKPSTSKDVVPTKKKKIEKEQVLDFFERMHKEKEANKERRHKERLKLLKDLFGNKPNENDESDNDN